MRITVLGKSPSWQDAAGACSGYLVQEEDFDLVLDCGNGVFSKLRRFCDYVDVDAVLISHLHADHFLDLVPFSYALTYAPRQQPVAVGGLAGHRSSRPPAPVRAGGRRRGVPADRRLLGQRGPDRERLRPARVRRLSDELEVGPFRIRFCEVPHYVAHLRGRADDDGCRFTFSADCRPNDQLVAIRPGHRRAADRGHPAPTRADRHARPPDPARGRRARQAGRRAPASCITHFSDEMDPEWARAEAADGFGGAGRARRRGRRLHGLGTATAELYRLGRTMSERDLFANFERMRREMDELFGDVFERSGLTRRRGRLLAGRRRGLRGRAAAGDRHRRAGRRRTRQARPRDRGTKRWSWPDGAARRRRGRGLPAGGDRARVVPARDRARSRGARRPGQRPLRGRDAPRRAAAGPARRRGARGRSPIESGESRE